MFTEIKEHEENFFESDSFAKFLNVEGLIVHCISGDFNLGGGFARQLDLATNVREKLKREFPNGAKAGDVILIDGIFNLVTKDTVYQKPTYDSLLETLKKLRIYLDSVENHTTTDLSTSTSLRFVNVWMPRIGCGIDGLSWPVVKELINSALEPQIPFSKFTFHVYHI